MPYRSVVGKVSNINTQDRKSARSTGGFLACALAFVIGSGCIATPWRLVATTVFHMPPGPMLLLIAALGKLAGAAMTIASLQSASASAAAKRRNMHLFRKLAQLCSSGDFPQRQQRVEILVGFLANGAGLSRNEQKMLAAASRLYRTGLTSLPIKAGFDHAEGVRRAADIAARLLDGPTTLHRIAVDMARSHGESWDGFGAPSQLSGQTIPFAARLLQVALALDALLPRATDRLTETALVMITARVEAEAGRSLDPLLARLPSRDLARLAKLLGLQRKEAVGAAPERWRSRETALLTAA